MQLTLRLHSAVQNVSVRTRAIFYMLLSAFCFALVELVGVRFLEGITLYQLVWGRYAVHIVFMIVVLGPRYKTTLVKTSNLKIQILRSLTMFMMPVSFLVAATQMPPHDIWSVYWLSPLIMLSLSTLVLHEPVGSVRWIAALIGFGGVLLIHRPDMGLFSPAMVLAFLVGLAISLHLMFSRILRHDHPLTSLFHTALWVFAAITFLMPFVWRTPSLNDVLVTIFVGIFGLVTLFFLARSGEIAPLSTVASFSYTEAIWTLLLNALVFGTMPSKSNLLGVLLIIGVAVYLYFYEMKHPAPEAAEPPFVQHVDKHV
jgi:drug/metabolite transporter (DMT)-like permease